MRPTRHLPLVVVLAVLATACGDAAPTAVPSLASGSGSAGSGSLTFWVYPNNPATVILGDHKIAFGKNAVCDPLTSTYGVTEWDRPCTVSKSGVKITANWYTDAHGHPIVDFQPALRFNPSSTVTLYLMDKKASADPNYRIVWVTPSGSLVDESILDPSVATQVGSNGYKYRRVKHFSGYTLSTSRLGLDADRQMVLR